jgi:hypothetical protein
MVRIIRDRDPGLLTVFLTRPYHRPEKDEPGRAAIFNRLRATGAWSDGDKVPSVHFAVGPEPKRQPPIEAEGPPDRYGVAPRVNPSRTQHAADWRPGENFTLKGHPADVREITIAGAALRISITDHSEGVQGVGKKPL